VWGLDATRHGRKRDTCNKPKASFFAARGAAERRGKKVLQVARTAVGLALSRPLGSLQMKKSGMSTALPCLRLRRAMKVETDQLLAGG
jgi:hypothetical protein